MYIIIVGCGKVGYQLTKALIDADEEVLAIEQDSQRHAAIVEELGSIAISGDGSEMAVLTEAGAIRADVLIAVTGQDEDNLSFFLKDWYWGKYDSQSEDREIVETWNTEDYSNITCKG